MSAVRFRRAALKLRSERMELLVEMVDPRYHYSWGGLATDKAYAEGMVGMLGGKSGDFSALMTPGVGEEIEHVLIDAAERWERGVHDGVHDGGCGQSVADPDDDSVEGTGWCRCFDAAYGFSRKLGVEA